MNISLFRIEKHGYFHSKRPIQLIWNEFFTFTRRKTGFLSFQNAVGGDLE